MLASAPFPLWRCLWLKGIRSSPLLSLTVCLAGGLHISVESEAVSGHVPSVMRRDHAVMVPLTLRHPCSRCLKPGHPLTRLLQEANGFRFVPRLLPRGILPALTARFIHRPPRLTYRTTFRQARPTNNTSGAEGG